MTTTRPSSWCSCALVILVVLAVFGAADAQAKRRRRIGVCFQPKVTGPCRAAFPRFYFNRSKRTCMGFVYGGCGGNRNNFKTMAACRRRCFLLGGKNRKDGTSTSTARGCRLPPRTGPCRAYFTKYYFDSVSGRCQTFIYGGCRGNRNRFDTRAQCRDRCQRQLKD